TWAQPIASTRAVKPSTYSPKSVLQTPSRGGKLRLRAEGRLPAIGGRLLAAGASGDKLLAARGTLLAWVGELIHCHMVRPKAHFYNPGSATDGRAWLLMSDRPGGPSSCRRIARHGCSSGSPGTARRPSAVTGNVCPVPRAAMSSAASGGRTVDPVAEEDF